MIERLTVSNYRSLGRDVDLELGSFTALVGPNGSGKSNLVDVLRFVSDCMHYGAFRRHYPSFRDRCCPTLARQPAPL